MPSVTLGIPSMVHDVQTIVGAIPSGRPCNGSWLDKTLAGADLLMNATMDISMAIGLGEGIRAAYVGLKMRAELALHAGEDVLTHEAEDTIEHAGEEVADHTIEDAASHGCGGLSFAAATVVATNHGEQAIGTLKVGQTVLAYNPQTHKMEYEPILHVWINHDNDLVNLTITERTHAPHSAVVTNTSEVLHTNKKHPFLTIEKGFLPVAQLKPGMHILRADGSMGVITGWKMVPGTQIMYNLEVTQDHTFTVGIGEWIVHNSCGPLDNKILKFFDRSDLGDHTEGEMGLYIRMEDDTEILRFHQNVDGPTGRVGDVDAETQGAIWEAKSGGSWDIKDTNQIIKLLTNTQMNPTGKPVVLYAPNPDFTDTMAARAAAAGAYVARNPEELIELVKLLG